ncbi:MAG TPA: hypothetical protein VHM20_06115 [Gammaproteobacteria bacterium]|jgi:hypothetical protein|nr:hypothetical protein [Gammaproteobacteria bacterium]
MATNRIIDKVKQHRLNFEYNRQGAIVEQLVALPTQQAYVINRVDQAARIISQGNRDNQSIFLNYQKVSASHRKHNR